MYQRIYYLSTKPDFFMKNNRWGFAMIGMGSISHFHIKSIQELRNARLIAVCSANAQRAQESGQQYQVPYYTNYKEMLKRPDIDIVCVCTISGEHLGPTLAAAKHGKHIITEKPLEVSLERADLMIEACRRYGVKLACIFQNRFRPTYIKMKQAISEGKIGKIVLANAYIKWYRDDQYYASRNWRGTFWGDGGAALINQSIHTIDLLQDVMGPVSSVYGKVKTMTHDIEGEDLGLAILSFSNGAMGTIEGSTSIYPGYPERLEFHGAKGSIVYEGGEIVHWNVPDERIHTSSAAPDSGASDPLAIDYNNHKLQIQDMLEALAEEREPLVNGEEGRKSLEIIQAIYRSSKAQKEVSL